MASYPQLPRESFRVLRQSWLEYVDMERKKDGNGWDLPRGRYCACDKSMTSYPHWPPTCQSEAVDQLHCLVWQSYPHRQCLAHTWMAFLLGKATDDDTEIISLVRNSCPVLLQSENDTPKRRRGKFDCEGIRRPVLEANSSHCLCLCLCTCFCHREECPVHRLT